jgi:putative ABC transport system ATP-binding protein
MISLKNVEKVYQTKEIETLALNSINLTISNGEFASIMGPSGCGKSTLLNVIGLLDAPSSGEMSINGQHVLNHSEKKLAQFRNEYLGFIFQSFHLINDLSVLDNVELPLLYRKGVSSNERKQKAMEVLEKVGLSARIHHYPTQLSGGQKQRVAIARAIIGNPGIILADEPTGNLDSKMGHEIMDLLMELNNEGTTIVMVTHDETLAQKTNRIIRLFDGSLVN